MPVYVSPSDRDAMLRDGPNDPRDVPRNLPEQRGLRGGQTNANNPDPRGPGGGGTPVAPRPVVPTVTPPPEFVPRTTSTPSIIFNGVYFNRRRAQNTKRKRKRKLIPVKPADAFDSLEAYARSERFKVDMVRAWIESNQVFPGGYQRGRKSQPSPGITRIGARGQLARKQGGFVAPKGLKAPPAGPAGLPKPPKAPPKPPTPPRKPPQPPRASADAVPPAPRPVRPVPIPPWWGPGGGLSDLGKRQTRTYTEVSGIGKRVSVGGGLTVIAPGPQNSAKNADARAKEISKIGKIEKAADRGLAAGAEIVRKAQKTLEKIRGAPKIFEKVLPKISNPWRPKVRTYTNNPFAPSPTTPKGFRRFKINDGNDEQPGQPKDDLTPLQDPAVPSRPASTRECPNTRPKKKRKQCRQGYFSETAKGIKFTTWSTRKCPASSRGKSRSRRTPRMTTS